MNNNESSAQEVIVFIFLLFFMLFIGFLFTKPGFTKTQLYFNAWEARMLIKLPENDFTSSKAFKYVVDIDYLRELRDISNEAIKAQGGMNKFNLSLIDGKFEYYLITKKGIRMNIPELYYQALYRLNYILFVLIPGIFMMVFLYKKYSTRVERHNIKKLGYKQEILYPEMGINERKFSKGVEGKVFDIMDYMIPKPNESKYLEDSVRISLRTLSPSFKNVKNDVIKNFKNKVKLWQEYKNKVEEYYTELVEKGKFLDYKDMTYKPRVDNKRGYNILYKYYGRNYNLFKRDEALFDKIVLKDNMDSNKSSIPDRDKESSFFHITYYFRKNSIEYDINSFNDRKLIDEILKDKENIIISPNDISIFEQYNKIRRLNFNYIETLMLNGVLFKIATHDLEHVFGIDMSGLINNTEFDFIKAMYNAFPVDIIGGLAKKYEEQKKRRDQLQNDNDQDTYDDTFIKIDKFIEKHKYISAQDGIDDPLSLYIKHQLFYQKNTKRNGKIITPKIPSLSLYNIARYNTQILSRRKDKIDIKKINEYLFEEAERKSVEGEAYKPNNRYTDILKDLKLCRIDNRIAEFNKELEDRKLKQQKDKTYYKIDKNSDYILSKMLPRYKTDQIYTMDNLKEDITLISYPDDINDEYGRILPLPVYILTPISKSGKSVNATFNDIFEYKDDSKGGKKKVIWKFKSSCGNVPLEILAKRVFIEYDQKIDENIHQMQKDIDNPNTSDNDRNTLKKLLEETKKLKSKESSMSRAKIIQELLDRHKFEETFLLGLLKYGRRILNLAVGSMSTKIKFDNPALWYALTGVGRTYIYNVAYPITLLYEYENRIYDTQISNTLQNKLKSETEDDLSVVTEKNKIDNVDIEQNIIDIDTNEGYNSPSDDRVNNYNSLLLDYTVNNDYQYDHFGSTLEYMAYKGGFINIKVKKQKEIDEKDEDSIKALG